ncbi:MAG: type II secretion system F family protein [Candidatus Saganbacteria bacterium]|nr:type II secretion system F family protein [Candidatus Saganbacteria bacterium]
MPFYIYQGIDKFGNKVRKTIESPNRDVLAENLLKQNFTILSVKEKKPGLDIGFIDEILKKSVKVKIYDLVMFLVQLSNMLSAGMTLPAALTTLAEQTDNKKLKSAVAEISEDIKQGRTFSESLEKHKDIFSSVFVNMVAAGETSGNLDEILSRLAGFTEHEAELGQKISSAMMYPMILMITGIIVVCFVVTTVIPPFAKIFMDAGVPLPLPTLMLFNLNLIIRATWIYLIIAAAAGWTAVKFFSKDPAVKIKIDSIKLNMPLWGDLLRKVTIARLSRTLSALLSSGVPMIQALEITEKTIDIAPLAAVIRDVAAAVGKGQNLSEPLRASRQFPPMTVHMIAVGEETGTIETMLNKIGDFYDMASDYAIKKMTSLLEPMFLVIIAVLVGFIFASILLPIFQMVKTLKH